MIGTCEIEASRASLHELAPLGRRARRGALRSRRRRRAELSQALAFCSRRPTARNPFVLLPCASISAFTASGETGLLKR